MISRPSQLPKYTGKHSKEFVTRLVDNYRSPIAIFNFLNHEFYNMKTNPTAIDTRKGKFLGWNLLPNAEFPIIPAIM